MKFPAALLAALLFPFVAGLSQAQNRSATSLTQITVPAGYTVELAAAAPLVEHPLMAGFDDRGRLYIAENAGLNLPRKELEAQLPNYISRLEDTDGDGKFDKRTVFADKLTFPQGALWHRGWLYVASSGAIWRFQDRNDDGVADVRQQIVGQFGYTGNAADVHGCFLGPDGRIYWCEGRHGHEITASDGTLVSKGKAARIFSSREDGSDVQVHCGGGMDNPVEIDWTNDGEMLGTVNILYQKRGDCLVHWMHGGVYPRHDQPLMLAEFQRTGPALDAVYDYGHVAVSGCARIRGPQFAPHAAGERPAATFFVTQFNTHKVVRTDLFREGATFRPVTTDFLHAASDDFHPTDVLEDADGSLLVIDTGGWFRIGCPVSQVAKPELLGAIYRIRRTDAQPVTDPRGSQLAWDKLAAHELIALLADQRPAVQARALERIVEQGDRAVPYLLRTRSDKDAHLRQSAVWALGRIGTAKARAAVRSLGLADVAPEVALAAVHSSGVHRDAAAADELIEMLRDAGSPPQLVREAATALGRIGSAEAVPAILERLGQEAERVLEHALIFALIEIDDRGATAAGLAHDSPRTRRAALIALDQMRSGELQQEEVASVLNTSDDALLSASLDVISRRGWTSELVGLAGRLLAKPERSEAEAALISGALVAFAKEPAVQSLVAERLTTKPAAPAARRLLLEVVANSGLKPLPATWLAGLRASLLDPSEETAQAAIGAITTLGIDRFDAELANLSASPERSTALQVAALFAVVTRLPGLDDHQWLLLNGMLSSEAPLERMAAARAAAAARLTPAQLQLLLPRVERAGPLEFKSLVAAFEQSQNAELLQALARAVVKSPGNAAWSLAELTAFAERLPSDARPALAALIDERAAAGRDQAQRLAALDKELPAGRIAAGRTIFFSRKAACSACHRVGNEGGKIGPDLTTVGQRRNQRDLLEAVLYPSSSLARGYESLLIQTDEGHTLTGLIERETSDAIHLRVADQSEVRLARDSILDMKPSTVSIMPAGLENTMTREQLADLMAYLKSLK